MGEEIKYSHFNKADYQQFFSHLEEETMLLKSWFDNHRFSSSPLVAGYELEAWLINKTGNPVAINDDFLRLADNALLSPELAKFNIELNVEPEQLSNKVLSIFEHKLNTFLQDSQLAPLDRIKGFVRDAIQGMAKYEYQRGCLVGNLGQEMGSLPEPYRASLLMVLQSWQQKFEVCLEEARAAAEIPIHSNSKQLAFIFWIGWEGAVLRAKLEQSPQPLQSFADYFFDSLRC